MDKINIKECVKKDLHDKLKMYYLELKDYDFIRNVYSVKWKKKKTVNKDIPSTIHLFYDGSTQRWFFNEDNKVHRLNGPAIFYKNKEVYGICGCVVHKSDFIYLKDLYTYKNIFQITNQDISDMFMSEFGSSVLNLCSEGYFYENVVHLNDKEFDDFLSPWTGLADSAMEDWQQNQVWFNGNAHFNASDGLVSPNIMKLGTTSNDFLEKEGLTRIEQIHVEELMFASNCFTKPAFINKNKDKFYIKNKKLHRVDGPAIVRSNGDKEYYLEGNLVSEKEHSDHFEATVCAWSEFMPYYIKYGYLAD